MAQMDTSSSPASGNPASTVAFQGEPGANSHIACMEVFPDMIAMACRTFEGVCAAVMEGRAYKGMIPLENSLAGRVTDIHRLMPVTSLYITGEHFLRVRHRLLGVKGARLEDMRMVHSHEQALGQCREMIRSLGLEPVVAADTAGAAREIADAGDKTRAAIATTLAARIHGLDIIRDDMGDSEHNVTRFVFLAAAPDDAPADGHVITSFVFRVRNVPAALYKALGGFATNGVNMTKLESYQLEGNFNTTHFYADIEGHPETPNVRLALEELSFFTSELRILGVYKAARQRRPPEGV